jgi:ankyrin repeat domain-containing protein 50
MVEKKREECEEKRWKFNINGRQIILRDVAEKVIVWINKFKEIGDVAVNFDPIHAALPWAGVRFLLQV